MKAKKILSALLAFAMIFSMLNISVFAEETAATVVAKINDTGYTTLAEAVTAANAGDTITLLQSIDSIPNINKAITIKGENTGIAVNALIAENFPNINGTVAFENLVFNQRISTENASSDQSNLTLKFVGCTFNVPAENTYAIQAGASWNNDVLGELYIENCTFTTNATSFVKGYMVYAQCVEKVTIKDSGFNGNSAYRGAIHLGDSTVYATTAVIEGNTITNTARGVQVGNRVEGSSLTINNNTFSNVNAISGETESGSVYIHEVANAATTDVTYTNNKITESNDATPVIFSENATGAVSDFVSSFNGNTVNSIAVSTEDTGVYNDTAYVAPTPVEVTTYAELVEALAAGGEIKLTADITTSEALVTSGVTATIDLNRKTLNVRAGDNRFEDATNLTIENGTINIDGVVASANAIFRIDEYEKTLVTTVTLNNVNVTGSNYSSAFGIFYIGASSVLNVNGGTWTLSNDKFSAGGVFKADSPDATLNISGAAMDLHNVRRGVTYANTTITDSTLKIYGDADGVDDEMKHGFNCSPLTVTNSSITITDMVGRGITAECGAISISEGSTVTIENVQEATIDVRSGQTVTVSADSTVSVDKEPTITSGTISGTVVEKGDLIITTAEELIEFAKDVNENKNEHSGKVVSLSANINLEGSETNLWTPIGASGDSAPKFRGTFNGNGYTISNLYVKQGAAYHAAGLFGATNGTIKNLTIDGAYVESLSSGSATVNGTAVVAGSTAYGATIDNVHVKNATVKGNRYVAGIVGYMDGSVTNCSIENVTIVATPDNLTGSYDNGDKVGGIVGYTNSGATEISGCELKGEISITGYRDIGGIVGMVQSNAEVSENTNNSTLTITVDQKTNYYGDKTANAGEFTGRGTASAESTGNITTETANYTTETIVAPKGTISKSYTVQDSDRSRIYGEITGMSASESVVIKLYSDDTLLSTTTLINEEYLSLDTLSYNIVVGGRTSSSWNTVWEDGHPVADVVPNKVVLYIDETEMNSAVVTMDSKPDNLGVVTDWTTLDGVAAAEEKLATKIAILYNYDIMASEDSGEDSYLVRAYCATEALEGYNAFGFEFKVGDRETVYSKAVETLFESISCNMVGQTEPYKLLPTKLLDNGMYLYGMKAYVRTHDNDGNEINTKDTVLHIRPYAVKENGTTIYGVWRTTSAIGVAPENN